ncbi:STAS domain-containing protein [Sphingomonas crocodyli]|uniref:STAS domain-containing protein n=1 Tax=Sphingomonas crocodyli TaxID=1979270 RepID=A0A437M467_9SPHN|nr:STAS domain-containing protein [Sphingomonas crocodyli]RVT92501.1 STAS domain-containing protein [Sphingomonas crocodyli]
MTRIILPQTIDRQAVVDQIEPLRAAFEAGVPVEIVCDAVEQIGQAGLQLLMSAVRTGRETGVALSLSGAGGAVEAAARLAGMSDMLFAADGTGGDAR